MIPKSIQYKHVLDAIDSVDRNGVPGRRQSKTLNLVHKGKNYPPKYIVGLASKFSSGQELDPDDFSSGDETISFLRSLGFTVVDITNVNR